MRPNDNNQKNERSPEKRTITRADSQTTDAGADQTKAAGKGFFSDAGCDYFVPQAYPLSMFPSLLADIAKKPSCQITEADQKKLAVAIATEVVAKLKQQNGEPSSLPRLRIGPDEMCKSLGIKRRTLTDWQRKRLIPFERIGPSRGRSTILFDIAAVDRALKKWRIGSVGE